MRHAQLHDLGLRLEISQVQIRSSGQDYPTQKVDTNLDFEAWSVVFPLDQLVFPGRSHTVLHHHTGAQSTTTVKYEIATKKQFRVNQDEVYRCRVHFIDQPSHLRSAIAVIACE